MCVKKLLALSILICVTQAGLAQESSTLVDPVNIRQHWNAARVAAGEEWSDALDFFCGNEPDLGQRQADPLLEPTRLFDNLYIFGRSGTVVYALISNQGIILLDSGYQDQEQSVLIASLQKLGLRPEDIKLVILVHGHQDHSGGAKFLQEAYGAKIVLTEQDWQLVDQYPDIEAGVRAGPQRDFIAEEGVPIVLGDTTITPVLIPGHTPGSLGLIFEVQDGDRTHQAGLFGGTILLNGRITNSGLKQYIESLAHFAAVAAEKVVEVELQNHPMFNNLPARLEALKIRKLGQENPFVVGEESYQRLLSLMSECTKVELAERGVTL